ncbi:MAG: hypothetical protein K9K66_05505 [Desulfarculaceae bacterium]|nr:hypothetical protein [Desulfarculaceae bacterium]MCF8072929.1 hypothetical protein [Desulfarculaceae bacterium]MCF8101097.1 hypothetical protein [Desulfarculaceae bacterium]MCF8115516.1 hypothetical protein [Desulfarculaceae bacterium]
MSTGSPCIFIAVNNGFGARYLLRSDILPGLIQAGVKVVVLSPNADEDYFRQEFEALGASVELFDFKACGSYFLNSQLQIFLKELRWYAMPGRHDQGSLGARFAAFKNICDSQGPKAKLRYQLIRLLRRPLMRWRGARRLLLALEERFFAGNAHRELFERYRPSLVLTTSLGYFDYDQYLMREAKRHGARRCVVILSWDNTSGKGLPGASAEHLVAWTQVMKTELVKYYDQDPAKIFVGGVAHFDVYAHPERWLSRADVCVRFGLDPERPIIFFGTRTPNKFPWTPDYIRLLAEAIQEGRLARPCSLLVRLHPNHFQGEGDGLKFAAILEQYQAIKDEYPFVAFNDPEILSTKLPSDMPAGEMTLLASLVGHSAMVISYYSTLMLEAAAVDKPIINWIMHAHNVHLGADDRSVYTLEHIVRICSQGAERTAEGTEDIIAAINQALEHPELRAEGRALVKAKELGPNQGHAGRAIAAHLAALAQEAAR